MSVLNEGRGRDGGSSGWKRSRDASWVEDASDEAKLWDMSNKQDRGPSASKTGEEGAWGGPSESGVASGSVSSCDLTGEVPMNRPISMESPRRAVLMT